MKGGFLMVDVYISPSTQEANEGFGSYGTEEMRMNLIADIVEYELQRHGVTTARNKPAQSLTEVVAESNALKPKAHLAIHSNASFDGTRRGTDIYIYRKGGKAEELAEDISTYLEPIVPTKPIVIREGFDAFDGKGYFELRRTAAPANLIEVAYHDNPADAQFIIDNIYELGSAISKGTLEFLGRDYNPDTLDNINALKNQYNELYFF
jgi:N-acetylmuramoyl-L-alanine amidase